MINPPVYPRSVRDRWWEDTVDDTCVSLVNDSRRSWSYQAELWVREKEVEKQAGRKKDDLLEGERRRKPNHP